MDKLIEALRKLDTANDNHWTADGQPRLDTVRMLMSDQTVSRDAVDTAAPGFTRATAATWQPAAQDATAQAAQAPQGAPGASQAQDTTQAANAPQQPATAAQEGATLADSMTEAQKAVVAGVMAPAAPVAPQAPQASGAPAAVATPVDVSQEADLEKALAAQHDRVMEMRNAAAKLDAMIKEEAQKEDDLRARLDAIKQVTDSTPSAIQAYLKAQREALQERGVRKELLKQSGIDLKQLAKDLKSPLDTAIAQRVVAARKAQG